MRLFLIRHAESEHNVTHSYAGSTDSSLTNHGVLQIERLAQYFQTQEVVFTHVFTSDMQRARMTAEGICARLGEQQDGGSSPLRPALLPLLREKNFGSLEGRSLHALRRDGFDPTPEVTREPESKESVTVRAQTFVDDYLAPLIRDTRHTEHTVAIVSHNILLQALWHTLRSLFLRENIVAAPGVEVGIRLPPWANTGYMELDISELDDGQAPTEDDLIFSDMPNDFDLSSGRYKMTVLAVNEKEHLKNLNRTRGVGSAKHDASQRRIDSFFQ
ncbi:hypothetical protein AJ79_08299 [Helicocarpus griseus UAMH5409]|uniref:Phosphoglycerate mutase n=1 Tax=Helicocarpus griseus UAMH5409 TaxID=1447875 RepID=A0A2B7WTJ0_9EURO|nr:hypothetical protein AJ79_08299 [Helicocarpus griseus UAMH5409]